MGILSGYKKSCTSLYKFLMCKIFAYRLITGYRLLLGVSVWISALCFWFNITIQLFLSELFADQKIFMLDYGNKKLRKPEDSFKNVWSIKINYFLSSNQFSSNALLHLKLSFSVYLVSMQVPHCICINFFQNSRRFLSNFPKNFCNSRLKKMVHKF